MYQQAPLQRGGRLPPSPQPGPGPTTPGLQDRLGNAVLLDLLRQRRDATEGVQGPMPGQGGEMGIQRFEPIGESSDEVVIGGTLPGMHQEEGYEFLHGRAAIDDYSLKVEAGLLSAEENGFSLVRGGGQAGFWWDESGDWNLGAGGDFDLVSWQHDFLGEPGDHDGFMRAEAGLVSAGAGARYGGYGNEGGTSYDTGYIGISGGTGPSADRDYDTTISARASMHSAGTGLGIYMSDVDNDGVQELNVNGLLALGPGFGIDISSEVVGGLINEYVAMANGTW